MRIHTVALVGLALAASCFAEKKVIQPKGFPSGRPFSTGILVNGTLYVSGFVGNDLKTGQVPKDFEAEVRLCLDHIGLVLKEAGMNFQDVVAVQVYLTDIALFQRMNTVYTTYFKEPRPTRTTVGNVTLAAPAARVEITVTAQK